MTVHENSRQSLNPFWACLVMDFQKIVGFHWWLTTWKKSWLDKSKNFARYWVCTRKPLATRSFILDQKKWEKWFFFFFWKIRKTLFWGYLARVFPKYSQDFFFQRIMLNQFLNITVTNYSKIEDWILQKSLRPFGSYNEGSIYKKSTEI